MINLIGTFFLKMSQPWSLFVYFCLFVQKILGASGIQTRIVRVEGRKADHKTTITAHLIGT